VDYLIAGSYEHKNSNSDEFPQNARMASMRGDRAAFNLFDYVGHGSSGLLNASHLHHISREMPVGIG
jgi:hypothetical protein